MRARRERLSEAGIFHLQPRRAGTRIHQAAVHRPAVRGRGEPGGLCVHSGARARQHGADADAAGIHPAAGGTAAASARDVAGGALGRIRGAILRGVPAGSGSGALPAGRGHAGGGGAAAPLHARDRAVPHPARVEDLPQLRLRIQQAVLAGMVGRGLRRGTLPHQGTVRMHGRAERGRAPDAGRAVPAGGGD